MYDLYASPPPRRPNQSELLAFEVLAREAVESIERVCLPTAMVQPAHRDARGLPGRRLTMGWCFALSW